MVQEIIVYRSPAEAAAWDILSNSSATFPAICAVVVFFLVAGVYSSVMPQARHFSRVKDRGIKHQILRHLEVMAGIYAAATAAIYTFYVLYI